MSFDQEKIKNKIIDSLMKTSGFRKKQCLDIAFHMTDWTDNLESLVDLYNKPDNYKPKEAKKILLDFLIHASEHVITAHKLLTGEKVRDIFNVGAIEGNESQEGRP